MGTEIEALGEWIAEQAAHLDAATHRLLTAVREFDAAGGWYSQGARSCAEWLAWRVGWSNNTARDRVRVAQRLGELPLVDEALRCGELSYCKVRAIARVATPENEAVLVEMARKSTGAQLDQICRKYAAVKRQGTFADERNDASERYLWRRDLDSGFVEITARLHPEEAAAVWTALDRIVKERFQRGAAMSTNTEGVDAAHEQATLAHTDEPAMRAIHEHADEATIRRVHEHADEATIHRVHEHAAEATIRRVHEHADEATIHRVHEHADEATLHRVHEHADEATIRRIHEPDNEASSASVHGEGSANIVTESVDAATAHSFVARTAVVPSVNERTVAAAAPRFGRVDALVSLAEEVLRGERKNRSPVELVVTVAAETLCDPQSAADPIGSFADGTCVSAETIRRLSCDCGVVVMTEDAEGRPLSVGRKTRSIPASIKRALLKRDQRCRFPGCQNQMFVEGHHIEHWAQGGETSLANLIGLCSYHHRFVHEYGYRIELDEHQVPWFYNERGVRVVEAPVPAPDHRRGWPTITAQNRTLAITAETPACGWDGDPVDYGWAIDNLVSVDRERTRA